jgi:hypothetical protein
LIRCPEGKGHRWEDNIKVNVKEIECEVVDWIHLAQDRHQSQAVVSTVISHCVPQNVGNFLNT